MLKLIIVAVVSWIIGVLGWSQIIGSIQNLALRKKLLFTMIFWIIIMCAIAFVSIVKLDSLLALAIGYAISFVQVARSGRIQ